MHVSRCCNNKRQECDQVQYIMDTIHDGLCAELRFNIRKEMGVKLDNEQLHDHVPKLVETGHEGKVTML